MTRLTTLLDPASDGFKANAAHNRAHYLSATLTMERDRENGGKPCPSVDSKGFEPLTPSV